MRRTRQSARATEEPQPKDERPSTTVASKRRKVVTTKKSETSVVQHDEGSVNESSSEEFESVQSKGPRKTPSGRDTSKSHGKSVAASEVDEEYKESSSEESENEESEYESEHCSSDSDFETVTHKQKGKAKSAAKPSFGKLTLGGTKVLRTNTSNDSTLCNTSPYIKSEKKVKKPRNPDSSSESSSDEFVRVKPSDSLPVDMQPVVSTSVKTEDPFAAIEKSIFSGISTLSGSESESETEYTEVNWPSLPCMSQAESITENENPPPVSKVPPRSKGKGRKVKVEPKIDTKSLDISQLLKLGEGLGSENLNIPKFVPSDDDLTDLEEVSLDESELKEEKPKYVIPKEGVEITLDVPEVNEKRKKKDFDVQAFLLRRLNNRKRSIQVLIHKVHLLGCISHGRYVNSVLNADDLMGVSLSLIPSQQCYPPKHADLAYLEKFLLWFNRTISLKDAKCISKFPSNLLQSLLKQFDSRTANSKRDLVFMFISVLRSLGIKARLVLSLQPAPLKLASTDLCAVLPKKAVDSLNYYVEKHNTERKKSKKSKRKRVEVQPEVPKHSAKKSSNPRKKNENKSKYFAEKLKKPAEEKEIASKQPAIKEESTSKYFKKQEGTSSSASQRRKRRDDGAGTSKQSEECEETRKKSPIKNTTSKQAGESKSATRKSLPKRQARENAKPIKSEDSESDLEPAKKQPKRDVPKRTSGPVKQIARKRPAKKLPSKKNVKKPRSESESDSDFEPVAAKEVADSSDSESSSEESEGSAPKVNFPKKPKKKWSANDPIDRRVLSSDSSGDDKQKKKASKKKAKSETKEKKIGVDVWTEVFLEAEEKWFSVDIPQKKIHCSSELHGKATQPVLYVVAFSPDLSIKDVTRRYVVNWTTIKQRVDEVWWEKTLKPFHGRRTAQDREEDEELSDQMLNHPLPTVIGEYKNHPLYALKRHLLKFEAIYPPEAPTLGFVRGEAVYARENVASLHSREVWVKEAKVVRAGEEAYKVVKARPKYNRATGTCITDIPLDLFGAWQVGEYVPPVAEDGKVPRNEYGNVELFKPCMLPKGTVHLPIAGLSRVAKKLGIDCAPAMIGFDFHSGGSHPTFDGYVVCEEFKDTLLDAWTQEVEMAAKRAAEKREKRVYDNWKRLIKGLLIRERLKDRYAFGEEVETPAPKPSTSKEKESSSKSKSSRTVFKKIPANSRAKRKD